MERGNGDREGEDSTSPQIRKEDPERATKHFQSFYVKGWHGNRNENQPTERDSSKKNGTKQKKQHKETPKEQAPRKKKPKEKTQQKDLIGVN